MTNDDPAVPNLPNSDNNVSNGHDHSFDDLDLLLDQTLYLPQDDCDDNIDHGDDPLSFLDDMIIDPLENEINNNNLNTEGFAFSSNNFYDNQNQQHDEIGSSSNCGEGNSGSYQGVQNGYATLDNMSVQYEGESAILPSQMLAPNDNNDATGVYDPYSSSGCQLLRQIVHTNGTHTTTLELHGTVGCVYLAIHQNQYYVSDNPLAPPTQDFQMFDLSEQSSDYIKEFLQQYIEEHRQKGYILMQEPLSSYYEALCSGYSWVNNSGRSPVEVAHTETDTSDHRMNQAIGVNILESLEVPTYPASANPPTRKGRPVSLGFKTELALQRERIRKMTLSDIARYFDVPIDEACKELGLCATVIKKKLRSFKIPRWPYRKVISLKNKILKQQQDLVGKKPEARIQAEAVVVMHQQMLADILRGDLRFCGPS